MSAFRVGDVCVIVRVITSDEFLGMECEIVDALHEHNINGTIGHNIVVFGRRSAHPEGWFWAQPWQLRLRRPPSWDQWLYDTKDVEREGRLPSEMAS